MIGSGKSKTVQVSVTVAPENQEIILAELASAGAHAFQFDRNTLLAWANDPNFSADETLAKYKSRGIVSDITLRTIAYKNWNERWESSIKPVVVEPFFVRPTFSKEEPPKNSSIEIIIDPKMSFGTAHHETTRLILGLLPTVVQPGCRVYDVGTGTGILAIACAKLGARNIVACDIDPWSIENAHENMRENGVGEAISLVEGDVRSLPVEAADVLVANINRNAILADLHLFASRVTHDGSLILSGLLAKDTSEISRQLSDLGMTDAQIVAENDWVAIVARRAV